MTDQRLEIIVANLLRSGVALAAVVVLAGGIWYLVAPGATPPNYAHFQGRPQTIRTLADMRGSEAAMLIGLLLLIATPILRVVFSMIGFALERDYVYVALTAIVLIVLLYSIGAALW
jgi:uncharacterized membrane protein